MDKVKIWKNDCLNRKEEGQFLINYLLKRYEQNKEKPFVLNLNAEWGFGKTYFLENLALELKEKQHPVVYFDAWKNDYTKDPLLAFISEVDNSLKEYFKEDPKTYKILKKAFVSMAPKILSSIVQKGMGVTFDELNEVIEDEEISKFLEDNSDSAEKAIGSVILKSAEKALKNHQVIKKSIGSFKENMKKLLIAIGGLEDKNLPLFILIDELDRCRPSYAIELLENIKHLFDIEHIIFIVATDSKQLSHSINAIYGNEFESQRYLKRFFDQEYTLRIPDSYEYSYYLFEQYGLLDNSLLYSALEYEYYKDKNLNVQLFSLYADFFKLVPRDVNQVMIVLSAIVLTWEGKEKLHLGYMLFLIMLKQKSDDLFLEYKERPSSSIFDKIVQENLITQNILIRSYKYSENKESFLLKEYIAEYIQFEIMGTKEFIQRFNKRDSSFTIINDTYNALKDEMYSMAEWNALTYDIQRTKDDFITPKLKFYRDMVLHSGQFTI